MKRILLLAVAAIFAINVNAQLINEDFESTPGEIPAGWLTVTPTFGSVGAKWHPTVYNENDAFRASSYYDNTNWDTEQWLITPAFNTEGLTTLSFSFDNEKASFPGNPMQVFISTDFDGDSANCASSTWDEITGLNLSTGTYEWVTSTHDLSAYTGNASVYIAFYYTSTNTEGAVWDVDNIIVTGSSSINDKYSKIRIYPNPATSVLNVKSVSNINTIVVTNVIGQRVMNVNNINSSNYSLNVEDFANGVYLINIKNTDGTSVLAKFVKK